ITARTEKDFKVLVDAFKFNKSLKELDLKYINIDDAGAKALSGGNWPNLRTLDLQGNRIGVEGAVALSNGNLPNLQTLDLQNNYITNDRKRFMEPRILSHRLRELGLNDSKMDDAVNIDTADLETLSSGNWPNLQMLDLRNNDIYYSRFLRYN